VEEENEKLARMYLIISATHQSVYSNVFMNTEGQQEQAEQIVDMSEEKLIAFRRSVYQIFQSSLDFQEAMHKLERMQIPFGMEVWLKIQYTLRLL